MNYFYSNCPICKNALLNNYNSLKLTVLQTCISYNHTFKIHIFKGWDRINVIELKHLRICKDAIFSWHFGKDTKSLYLHDKDNLVELPFIDPEFDNPKLFSKLQTCLLFS